MPAIARPELDYPLLSRKEILYPEQDGNPMSDNTLQFEWITALHFGFLALFMDDENVFVASDLLWYPVEGQPKVRAAPDVMIAFGRPKGHRGSYMQWREGGMPPQVVFEILSPGNTGMEMTAKFHFYQEHGVEEYYVYDPDEETFAAYLRTGDQLRLLPEARGWISPRTGVKFDLVAGRLVCTRPDGKPFLTYLEMLAEAREEREKTFQEFRRAEEEKRRAEEEKRRAEEEKQRADKLAAKLRELGIDPSSL